MARRSLLAGLVTWAVLLSGGAHAAEAGNEDCLLIQLSDESSSRPVVEWRRPVIYEWKPFTTPDVHKYAVEEGLAGGAVEFDARSGRMFYLPGGRIPYRWMVFDSATKKRIGSLPVAIADSLSSDDAQEAEPELGNAHGTLFVLSGSSLLAMHVHIGGKWAVLVFNSSSLDLISIVEPPMKGEAIGVMPDGKTLVWGKVDKSGPLVLQTLSRAPRKESRASWEEIPTVIKSAAREARLPPEAEIVSPAVAGRIISRQRTAGSALKEGAKATFSLLDLGSGKSLATWQTRELSQFELAPSGDIVEHPYEVVPQKHVQGGWETRFSTEVIVRRVSDVSKAMKVKLWEGVCNVGLLPSGKYLYATDGKRLSLYEVATGQVVKGFSPGKDDPSGVSGVTVYAGRPPEKRSGEER